MKMLDPRPLSEEIWEAPVREGFKPPSLDMFDGCKNSYEHVTSIKIHMDIFEAPDSLKCKMMSEAFKDATLRWHMDFSRASITSYQELVGKLLHQFAANRHKKMLTTSMFKIRHGPSKCLRDYLA